MAVLWGGVPGHFPAGSVVVVPIDAPSKGLGDGSGRDFVARLEQRQQFIAGHAFTVGRTQPCETVPHRVVFLGVQALAVGPGWRENFGVAEAVNGVWGLRGYLSPELRSPVHILSFWAEGPYSLWDAMETEIRQLAEEFQHRDFVLHPPRGRTAGEVRADAVSAAARLEDLERWRGEFEVARDRFVGRLGELAAAWRAPVGVGGVVAGQELLEMLGEFLEGLGVDDGVELLSEMRRGRGESLSSR